MSAFGGKADVNRIHPICPLIARSGHERLIKRHCNLAYRDAGVGSRRTHQNDAMSRLIWLRSWKDGLCPDLNSVTLTPKRAAARRRDNPASTASTIRTRRLFERLIPIHAGPFSSQHLESQRPPNGNPQNRFTQLGKRSSQTRTFGVRTKTGAPKNSGTEGGSEK